MKKAVGFFGIIILIIFLGGCIGGSGKDTNVSPITTKLNFDNILGTYVFKPDTFQAKKLGVNTSESITLTLTNEKVERFKSTSVYFYGVYHINKMVFDFTNKMKDPYTGIFEFYFFKNSVPSSAYLNRNELAFFQDNARNSNITFEVGKDVTDVLHIIGYISDPKYEVIKISDFKKVK